MAEPNRTAPRPGITVRALLGDKQLGITVYLAAGSGGLDRRIAHPRIQKSGLVLVGHTHGLVPERVQILGETELSYIEALPDEQQHEAASHLFSLAPGLVLLTRGVTGPPAFLERAEESREPLAGCAGGTSYAITEPH